MLTSSLVLWKLVRVHTPRFSIKLAHSNSDMLSTSVFVAALLTVLVAIATTTALPAAPGQLVYYQQMRPLYQPYRAYQPQYHHQHQATSNNKYALRRSAEQLGANDGAAFAQGNWMTDF